MFLKRPGMAIGKPIAKGAPKLPELRPVASLPKKYHQVKINSWKNAAQDRDNLPDGANTNNPVRSRAYDENGNVMKDADGNVMYDTTSAWQKFRGKKEYRSFSTDANGNTRMNIVTESRKGKRTETSTDAYATVTRKYDRSGTQVSEKAKPMLRC